MKEQGREGVKESESESKEEPSVCSEGVHSKTVTGMMMDYLAVRNSSFTDAQGFYSTYVLLPPMNLRKSKKGNLFCCALFNL